MKKDKKILVILLVILFAVLLYKFLVPVPRQKVTALTHTGEKYKRHVNKKTSPEKLAFTESLVRTDILNKPAFRDNQVKRDLFYPHQETMNNTISDENSSENDPVESVPKHMAEIELPQYSFFGSLIKEGVKTIFLSKGENIYLVKKGEKLDKNFIVFDINDQTMTLLLPNTNEEIKVRLQEDAPLRVIKIRKLDIFSTYKDKDLKDQNLS